MPTLSFSIRYKKNERLLITPEELISLYFYAVAINNSTDGTKLQNETILIYIEAAQREVEQYFGIKLFPELITENLNYYRDDYQNTNFPFIKTTHIVNTVYTLIGRINSFDQIRYPREWLVTRMSSDGLYYRHFGVVPNGSVVNADANVILTGVSASYGIRSYPIIPNYWYTQYETGFPIGKVPSDIINLVGLLASIPLLAIAGDLILGSGIASQSLSIDGLSQSISSTSSATNSGYGSRIIEYRKSIDATINRLRNMYNGVTFMAL